MPTNKLARPQPAIKIQDAAGTTITIEDIKRIARESAREEVQRLLGDEPPVDPVEEVKIPHSVFVKSERVPDHAIPVKITPLSPVSAQPAGERRFIAHLPAKDGGLPEQVHGTRNLETGQVVLDDAQGVYQSWVDFLNACHASGQTPTKIEDE